MQLSYYFSPLALNAVLVLSASCAKEDAFEEPTLQISTHSLLFERGMGERNISITTNQPKWLASSPQEGQWLSLVQEGNNLRVRVLENTRGHERSSHVLVQANGATERVEVRQSAADVLLDITPQAIVIPQRGGDKVVDISTNTQQYTITAEEMPLWLTITQHDEEVRLAAKANLTSEERSVKLYAKSGDQTREITVTQPGVQTYILPINPGTHFDGHKILEFEQDRGSFLREYAARNEAFGLPESYTFVTPSPIFSLIQYTSQDGLTPSTITTIGDGHKAVEACKSTAFDRFLLTNGFEPVGNGKARDYRSKTRSLLLNVTISERVGNEGVNLTFTPIIEQNADFPSFATLPLPPTELLQKPNIKLAQVLDYEQKAGSTETDRTMHEKHTEEVSLLQFKIAQSHMPYYSRAYYFYNSDVKDKLPASYLGSVESCLLLFTDVHQGLWQFGKKWHPTREVQDVLAKAGFSFLRSTDNQHFFVRSSDHLQVAILPVVDDGKTVLALLYSYEASTLTAQATALTRLGATLRP